MRVLHLYRPTLPGVRAQTVQVLNTAHALAARGHDVWLYANRARGNDLDAAALLDGFGLAPLPGLHLELAPTAWSPGAGAWFRWQVGRWCDSSPRDAVVYARELKYLGPVGERPRLVYEAHCLEKQRAAESPDEEPGVVEAWERAMIARANAVVTNSGGTLGALEAAYGPALPRLRRVIHNATSPDRALPEAAPAGPPRVVYAGSPRAYKGVEGLFAAFAGLPGVTLELVGERPEGPLPANVQAAGPVAYAELPSRLAAAHALVLPLEDNSFGRQFTSPLKLWDYLATGRPVVAADLPTVREIAGDLPFYYTPGDAGSLRAAVSAALAAGPRPRLVRTWADRAAELEAVLAEVVAGKRSAR